ncbi:fibronectin type III domain-containing protein [Streptomyces sp. NPDC056500]|uniref:fibronectin type III domain-containing protein n=1 Tax=Streptomyces sp. NPDC056500 TaxID=3345840 RepID=UPI0036BA7352
MTLIPRGRLRTVAALTVATTVGGLLTAVTTTSASAAVSCVSPAFQRQFFSNTSLSGTPKKTDCDSTIKESWGTGAPTSGLPRDNFGVRWSMTRDFGSGGPFALSVAARDGIRVYVDGSRKIDLWRNGSSNQSKTVNLTIPSGRHSLRIDYASWTGSANVQFTYAPRTTAAVDKVKPLVPGGVKVAIDHATARPKVSWAANKEMDLAGYRVYRRSKTSTTFSLAATTTATSHTDLALEPGSTYFYEVRAYDRANNASAGSVDVPVTTEAVTAPQGLTAKGIDSGVQLNWLPVRGAVRYAVSWRLPGGGEYSSIVNSTTFTDTTALRSVLRDYRVAAVDGANRMSPYSFVKESRLVAAPHEVTATVGPGAHRPMLKWRINSSTDGAIHDFHVYRSTTLPVDTTVEPTRCRPGRTTLPDGRREYTCVDSSAGYGTTYHYVVKAHDNRSRESNASAVATVTTPTKDLTPPDAVKGLTVKTTEYGAELDWEPNTEPDLKRYTVYSGEVRREPDQPAVCFVYERAHLAPPTTAYRYEDLPDGKETCYFIDAVDDVGNSNYQWTRTANFVFVNELDLTPSVPTPPGASHTVSSVREGSNVRLSWDAVPGATGYLVHHWNPVSKTYEKLTDQPVSALSYQHTNPAAGTTHFYWVSAVHADGSESAPAADWAIVPPTS